jgi:aryl-alcohol dehydrogenase-like predicted oxidoreductase
MRRAPVQYRYLGSSGLRVSELCLGTTAFGTATSAEESQRIWDRCIDRGVNFFDTADAAPESEKLLGKLSRGRRHSVVISTKVFCAVGGGPNDAGLSRKHIVRACEASLRRLQTDYIDVYLAHSDDFLTPLEETLSALDCLIRQGKVMYVGASNYNAWRLNEALWVAVTHHYARYCCLQALYNLHERAIEVELLPMCTQKQVGVVAWRPLARGMLASAAPEEVAAIATGSEMPEASAGQGVRSCLLRVARQVSRPAAQVALRWALSRSGISAVAVGASSSRQIEENLGVADLHLEREHIAMLDAASMPHIAYPATLEGLVRALREAQPRSSAARSCEA